jgi:hypothetical protein
LIVTFEYDGAAPSAEPLNITTDREFCCQFEVVDESLVVNPENSGVANVIVFLYVGRGGAAPPAHESYADQEAAEVLLDNNQCRFAPHVIAMRTSQTLVVGNSDSVAHNANFTAFDNVLPNLQIPSGGQIKLQFEVQERLPVGVACSIHPWMSGWVLVKDHPYSGVSDKDGRVVIKNLPAGEWTFQIWHEKAGYVSGVKAGTTVTDRGGRFTTTIAPGENQLGVIKLSPELFSR